MSRSTRRHGRLRWVCPSCRGSLLLDAPASHGKHYRACVTCRDDNDQPLEACSIIVTPSVTPTRNLRLIKSRPRMTRGR